VQDWSTSACSTSSRTPDARLAAAGLPDNAITERTLLCSAEPSVAQTILDVQQEGGFGTLVVAAAA